MHNLAYAVALLSKIVPIDATPNPRMTAAAVLPRQAYGLQTTIVGYYMNGTEMWSTWCNPGYRYCTSSTYGTCGLALDTACNVQVACTRTSVMVDREGYSLTCSSGTNTVCATNTIFQSLGDRSPVRSLACRGAGSPDASIYRSVPNPNDVSATTSSSSSTPVQSAMSRSVTGLVTVASQTGPTTTTSPSATAAPVVNPPEKSKAWIAGPVIGGLVAIAGIVFGLFFLRRRRSAGSSSAEYGQGINESKPPGYSEPKEQYTAYATPVYGPAELASPNTKPVSPAELGSK